MSNTGNIVYEWITKINNIAADGLHSSVNASKNMAFNKIIGMCTGIMCTLENSVDCKPSDEEKNEITSCSNCANCEVLVLGTGEALYTCTRNDVLDEDHCKYFKPKE